jgi:hypothetical protein
MVNNSIVAELINSESLAIYKPAVNANCLYLNDVTSSEVLAMAGAYRSLGCNCEVILISSLCYKLRFNSMLNMIETSWEAEKMESYDD